MVVIKEFTFFPDRYKASALLWRIDELKLYKNTGTYTTPIYTEMIGDPEVAFGTTAERLALGTFDDDQIFIDTTLSTAFRNSHAGAPSSITWTVIAVSTIIPVPIDYDLIVTRGLFGIPSSYERGYYNLDGLSSPQKYNAMATDKLGIFADDFTSYANDTAFDSAWPAISGTDDVNPNATDDRIDFKIDNTSGNSEGIYLDLVELMNDTVWTLRFKLVLTTYTGAGGVTDQLVAIGLSDNTLVRSSNQDYLGFMVSCRGGINAYHAIEAVAGVVGVAQGNEFTTDIPSAETRYVEVQRTSATTYDVRIYSDAGFTTTTDTKIGLTISASIDSLRYLKILSQDTSAATGTMLGYIDNIEIHNGVQITT